MGNTTARAWTLAGLAELARLQEDYARASALDAEGLALARETGDRYAISRLLCIQGRIAQAQGEHERAVTSYHESLSLAASIDASKIAGHCLLGLAQEALSASEFQQATHLFAAATQYLTLDRQLAPVERAAYERNLAELHAHLDAAAFTVAWAEGEAMTPRQALTVPAVRRHEQRPSPRPHSGVAERAPGNRPPHASQYPDGLTAREVEVLRLVAQGWTDAQIAGELVISTRSLNARQTSIYRKIRVSSRHAAAQYARTQGLV